MSFHPSLDPESFEAFLANALEVQQSGIDPQSLSVVVHIQRFIATAEFDVDRALHLIAERALEISHASGIAIALLESNQLVYRAGSGSASTQIGRHVPAVLCARSEVQAEILRVENAQNDSRVQADICKQFGAMSLMILPVYYKGIITGVLQVHFGEAHAFLDREVRAYRLMAGLAEEAISRSLRRSTDETVAVLPISAPAAESSTSTQRISSDKDEHPTQPVDELCRPHTPVVNEWAALGAEFARQLGQKINRPLAVNTRPVAAAISAAILLAIAVQIAHHHYAASSRVGSTYAIPSTLTQNSAASPVDTSAKSSPEAKRNVPSSSAFRRVRVAPNEVDYIAEDVTIRYFTNRPARPLTKISKRQVNIGEDVTIRYFSDKPALDSQTAPVPASQTAK